MTVNVISVIPIALKVRGAWSTKWEILTSYRAPLHGGVFDTFDPFAAETCRQAAVSGRSVRITARQTKWGHDLVSCELVPQEATV